MKICPLCQKQYEDKTVGFCAIDGQPLVEAVNRIEPRQPSAAQPVGAPFSASLAMTFFAYRFIENVPPESGTLAFCQPNVEVRSWKLVTELPIIAFWYLHENNFIRFTPVAKQGFAGNCRILVNAAAPANQASFPGLEYDFWEIIKRAPPGVTVGTVFKQFLGGHDPAPEKRLINRLVAWMIQLGYGQPDTSPKPFFRFSGRTHIFEEFVPDCERIKAQEQAAQIIHQRWMKFRTEQPDIFYYLFDDVVNAAIDRAGNTKIRSSYYFRARSFRRDGE